MTITRTSYPERVVIVLNADGSIKAAHQESLEAIADDGVIIQSRQLAAASLSAETLTYVLPSTAALTAQVAALTEERDAAIAQKEALQAIIENLTSQRNPVGSGGFAILTPVQLRLALLSGGITMAQVTAVIAAIPDATEREHAMTYWDYSLAYHRDHPLIARFGAALGLTSSQIDQMWSAAAEIQ